MRYYALITPSCTADAERNGFVEEIENLSEKIEYDQSIGTWDRFLRTPFVKKALGTFRVVGEERPLGDDIVICLRHVFARGSAQYERFCADPAALGRSPSDEELHTWLSDRKAVVPETLPRTSDSELRYLYVAERHEFEDFVYETQEWVERVRKLDTRAIPWLYEILVNRILVTGGDASDTFIRNGDLAVIFRRFPSLNRTILIAPLFGRSLQDQPELQRRFDALLTAPAFQDEELRRRSRRAYPAIVLADQEMWLSLQGEDGSNLALSPEETTVLDSVMGKDASTPVYPLFINGRPGSGKSTILKYLFAEHLANHLTIAPNERTPAPPLYLTYSERLLKDALATVGRLLDTNVQLRLSRPTLAAEVNDVYHHAFSLFHDYLRLQLPPDSERLFARERRIGFAEFRRLWAKKALTSAQTRGLSPELVWHVLRTYVKGMRDDEGNFCDPEAYQELPTKRRTVTTETFKRIYGEIWTGWFGALCRDEGWWDDQDLARAVLDEPDLELSRHPVVFCDEAQDFTRIELELIARLSLFSRRLVDPQAIRRIPIAFAGDPFQTLNPTGFQWSSVQSGFYEQIVRELDRFGRAQLKFNFQELSFNYRSTKPIVGFVNLIQALRGALFDINTLRPQHSWQDDSAAPPAIFSAEDADVLQKMRAHDELVLILPCQEGMEREYIAADTLLSQLASEGQPRNFLSAMTAKGLEFSRVVLYKFGEECLTHYPTLLQPLSTGEPHSQHPETALPLEYFVNRLFVAASRPKRALFIVDSPRALDQFWRDEGMRDSAAVLRRLPKSTANGWTEQDLDFPQPGFPDSWSQDRDDPLEIARQFMETGVAAKDANLLFLAAANYRRARDTTQAERCVALQHEFSDEWEEAGETYTRLGMTDDALRCFWNGGDQSCFESIVRHFGADSQLKVFAARFMCGRLALEEQLSFLTTLVGDAQGPSASIIIADPRWKTVVERLAAELAAKRDMLDGLREVYAQLQLLQKIGVRYGTSVAFAEMAYVAEDFATAAAIWEGAGPKYQAGERYLNAMSATAAYPESLPFLSRLRKYAEIATQFETHRGVALDEESAKIVAHAYVVSGNVKAAIQLAEAIGPGVSLLNGIIKDATVRHDAAGARDAAIALVRILARMNEWTRAVDAWSGLTNDKQMKLPVAREVVNQAATSEALAQQAPSKKLSGLLQTLVQTETDWTPERIALVGAAMERVGIHQDALSFYERVWKQKKIAAPPQTIEYCHVRWCRCKHRLAERYVSQNRKTEAEQQRAEADSTLRQLGIALRDVPSYPEVKPVTVVSQPKVDEAEAVDWRDAVPVLASSGPTWTAERIAATLRVHPDEVRRILDAF